MIQEDIAQLQDSFEADIASAEGVAAFEALKVKYL